ncbi:MAG: PfkB family carbohydrate kinase [Bryobacterales bacterium]|nr:PfkB family carbohydrate kinase [Bryobacteraceae bacterium]MDW8354066.1 PfkB family carbohydrate kinase [Bryobacterales bacterium]
MTAAEILRVIPRLSALVVGDICLDRWCLYDPAVEEPSRETGIPRIGVVATEVTPGAGGTVANNLAALGARRVAVLGITGDDGFAFELRRALQQRGIQSDLLVKQVGLQTFTYTKLINRNTGVEDRPRVDFINVRPPSPAAERRVLRTLQRTAESFDVILISDQAETAEGGVVTPRVRQQLSELAARYPSKVFFADSRMRPEHFRRVIVKPNQQEAEAACLRLFGEVDYGRLRAHVEAPFLVVTHGPRGALVVTGENQIWVETRPVANPVDICGAGDSFSAGAALALAAGASPVEAARFGNLVASVTIMKKGTGTAAPHEVLEAEEHLGREHVGD